MKTLVSKGVNTKKMTGKPPRKVYKRSFRDLREGACYHDPTGKVTGKRHSSKSNFYEQEKDAIDIFNDQQEKGFSIQESIKEVRKALDTGDWMLPTYYLPTVELVNPEITPLADTLARRTTQKEKVRVTSVEDGNEPTVQTDIESQTADYTHSDISWNERQFEVDSYSIMCGVTDKVILSSQESRQPLSIVENVIMETLRKFEEKNILHGNDVWTGDSLVENSTTSVSVDQTMTTESDIRDLITSSREAGANLSDLAIATTMETYNSLKGSLDDYTMYDLVREEDFGFGYETLKIDTVPILPTTQFGTISGSDSHTVCFNFAKTSLHMLQDSVVRPLGRTGAQEKIAVDTYGALVQERPQHTFSLDETS